MTTSSLSSPSLPSAPSSTTPWPQRLLLDRKSSRAALSAEARRVLDRLEEDQHDLVVASQWLSQAVDGIPVTAPSAPAVATLRAYLRDLADVEAAAEGVLSAAKLALDHSPAQGPVSSVVACDAPLVRYFSGLYEWCEQLMGTFEQLAGGLRRDEPIWPIHEYKQINRSFARFDALSTEIHALLQRQRASHPAAEDALRAIDHRLEELFWAASWLHLSLTRRFGS